MRAGDDHSLALFPAAPAEGLHQLLVRCLLFGYSGKLRMCPLSCQQHGLPGKITVPSALFSLIKLIMIDQDHD